MSDIATKLMLDLIIKSHGRREPIDDDANVALAKMSEDSYVLQLSENKDDRTQGFAVIVPTKAIEGIVKMYAELKDTEGAGSNIPLSKKVH